MQALWMLLGAFFFALMGVCIKYSALQFSTFEVVAWRGLIGVLGMLVVARSLGVGLRTRFWGAHLWRCAFGVSALMAWFYAIAHLHLAIAMVFNYMSSIWIAAVVAGGAVLYGGKNAARAQGPLLLCVLLGFLGVYLLLQPGIHLNTQALEWRAVLLGLISGFLAAMAYLQVTALGRLGEPDIRTVFLFSCATALVGIGATFAQGINPFVLRADSWLLLAVGVLASLGQLCLTRAYRLGSTLVVANLQYSGIVFAVLFGFVFFDETLPPAGWIGIALIMVCGIAATVLRHRGTSVPKSASASAVSVEP